MSERLPGLASSPFFGGRVTGLLNRFSMQAEGGANTVGEGLLTVGGGVKVWGWSHAVQRAGLWVDTSLRTDWADPLGYRSGYRSVRWRVELAAYVPMGIFDPRFQRVFLKIRAGADPSWIFYARNTGFEVPLAAGFEFRLAILEQLRAFVGYDHARDEQWGGMTLGVVGAFHGGLEASLPGGVVVQAQYVLATQGGVEVAAEWRW